MTEIHTVHMVGNAHRQRHRSNAPVKWEGETAIERATTDAEKLARAVMFYHEPCSASEWSRRWSILYGLASRVIAKIERAAADAALAKRREAERKAR